ncbi:Protein drumstick [Trachymyrmex cornetzi]|uniref:Protein drumstick n=1 Tax=Trachymyrmex cornetzi TaxID=471704 RepID=A0A195DHY0_9HYME|nr:Protein drumstick [Trachymyrmex cornetzi]
MFAIMPMETEGHGREFGRRQKMRAKCTVEFVCKYCQRRFTKPYNLMIHERSHKDDVTFTCEVCGKTFKRQDNLKQHRKNMVQYLKIDILNYKRKNSSSADCPKTVTVLTSRRSKPSVRPKETATALTFRINSLVMLQRVAFTRLTANRSANREREEIRIVQADRYDVSQRLEYVREIEILTVLDHGPWLRYDRIDRRNRSHVQVKITAAL